MLKDTPLKEIMVTKVITVTVDEAFSHVEEKLHKNRIRHLPVVNASNKLVGIITERDLYRAVSPRQTEEGYYYDKAQLDSFVLKHFMAPDPLTLQPESTLAEAIEIMATRKFGCIPIVKPDKTLIGIVTQIDVLKFISKWLSGG